MRKSVLITVAVLIAFTGIAYAGLGGGGSGSWRYKMTVEVETPEGLKTGSAVREVTVYSGLKLLPEQGSVVKIKGEAVVVDLGKRGMLFALVSGDSSSEISAETFYPERAWLKPEGVRYMSTLKAGIKNLDTSQYPLLVRFLDLTDPKSVEAISPDNNRELPDGYGGVKKKAEDAFGAGVKIKSIIVEMTNETVTPHIKSVLVWLDEITGYISGRSYGGAGLFNQLDRGHFIRGEK